MVVVVILGVVFRVVVVMVALAVVATAVIVVRRDVSKLFLICFDDSAGKFLLLSSNFLCNKNLVEM